MFAISNTYPSSMWIDWSRHMPLQLKKGMLSSYYVQDKKIVAWIRNQRQAAHWPILVTNNKYIIINILKTFQQH